MDGQRTNDRYRVVITDTETGDVALDECYNVIIAGFNGNEKTTDLLLTNASVAGICLGIVTAESAIEQTKAFLVSKGLSEKNLDFAVKAAETLVC